MTDKDLEDVINDVFDACVNPIANMMCSLLVMQVKKGLLTHDEARFVIASSVNVLNEAEVTIAAREMGANTLMRMLKALDAQA